MKKMMIVILHSLRTQDMALEIVLKNKINIDLEKVKLAALIHDYCKNVSKEELEVIENIILIWNFIIRLIIKSGMHLAPYIIEEELELKIKRF